MYEPSILDRYSHPYVRMPWEVGGQLCEPFVALGQDLEGVLIRSPHDLEDLGDVVVGDTLVE